jgi:5-methylcytosine-specific restriction endonuclease McrA
MRGAKGRRKRLDLARRDGARCFYCHAPYALWPTNVRWNLVLACQDCNTAKGDALPLGLLLALRPWLTRAQLAVAA